MPKPTLRVRIRGRISPALAHTWFDAGGQDYQGLLAAARPSEPSPDAAQPA
jgi:hypothetical protein